MPKKRIFLDECNGDPNLRRVFAPKDHVFTAEDFGIRGKKDPKVIDAAVKEKCTIVTVNKDFVDYYRSHPMRKGKWGTYGYRLIFLKIISTLSIAILSRYCACFTIRRSLRTPRLTRRVPALIPTGVP